MIQITKLLFITLGILCSAMMVNSQDHSGVKFAIDTSILRYLKTVNLNKFAQGKSLLPEGGLNLEKSDFPSYKIKISNMTVTNVKNPQEVEVFSRKCEKTGEDFLNVILTNFEVDIQTTFGVEVVSVFKDELTDSPIKIILEKVNSEFYFHNGFVKFNKLDVQIGEIEMKFNSIFFKAIYSIADKLIITGINFAVSNIYKKLEEAVNQFMTKQFLIDVSMGIGINATNVDRPTLENFERDRDTNFSVKSSKTNQINDKHDTEFLKLKNYNLQTYLENAGEKSTILKFGVHGSVYPNAAPDLQPNIKSALDMEYIKKTFNNEITLLLSDYSLNSLLFMAQQTGALKMNFDNDTNTILPFTIDTEGLANIIPEFGQKYPENKPLEIKLYVNPVNNVQPLINTQEDGSVLTFNFGLDFNVFNSSDPWDDPNKELQLNVTAHTKLQYLVSENKLNIICFKAVVDSVEKKLDELNVSEEELRNTLDKIINSLLKTYKPYMTGIDVSTFLWNTLEFRVNNLYMLTNPEYITLSIDLADI